MIRNKSALGTVMLLITALIWGSSFAFQSMGMEHVGPFTFNTVRSVLGGVALLPVILLMDRLNRKNGQNPKAGDKKTLILGGVCCGVALGVASALQQVGVSLTTVGKAGFITALYILGVPILGMFFGRRPSVRLWVCVAIAVVGLYLLCMTDSSFALSRGDAIVCLCAVCYAAHIMIIDHFAAKVDGVRMSCIQFFVAAVVSVIPMLLTETPTWEGLMGAAVPMLYAGVMSSGVGFTLQILSQKHVQPTVASLVMSLESVFAVLGGVVLLQQMPTLREWAGCAVMFVAIILAQLPEKQKQ